MPRVYLEWYGTVWSFREADATGYMLALAEGKDPKFQDCGGRRLINPAHTRYNRLNVTDYTRVQAEQWLEEYTGRKPVLIPCGRCDGAGGWGSPGRGYESCHSCTIPR